MDMKHWDNPMDPDRELLRKGIKLFNKGEFFEAHEVLEDGWKYMTGADREIYQGIIQVAMGYRHHTKDFPKKAGVLIRRGLPRLKKNLTTWEFLPLTEFVDEVETTLEWLDAKHKGEEVEEPLQIPVLPSLPK
jgi:uncharacterized protein